MALDKPFPFELSARHREAGESADPGRKLSGDIDPCALGGALRIDLYHFELHQIGVILVPKYNAGACRLIRKVS